MSDPNPSPAQPDQTPPASPARVDLARPSHTGVGDHLGAHDALSAAGARLGVELSLAAGRPVSAELVTCTTGAGAAVETGVWFAVSTDAGAGALLLERSMAVALADVLQGGQGAATSRPPSEIELHVLGVHLRRAVRPVSQALASIGVTAVSVTDAGRGAALRALTGAQVLHLEVAVTVGQDDGAVTGALTLVVPAPARGRGEHAPAQDAPQAVDVLADVPFDVTVLLRPTTLPAARVAALAVGDVVRVGHHLDEPVTGVVAHHPLFLANLGQHGAQHTVSITTLIKESTR